MQAGLPKSVRIGQNTELIEPYLGYFDVIRIQIRTCEPDADFYQDGPRYTELTVMYYFLALFALNWHYLGYFDVIRIQIWICEPVADFDQVGPRYIELTVMYHY